MKLSSVYMLGGIALLLLSLFGLVFNIFSPVTGFFWILYGIGFEGIGLFISTKE